MPNRLKSKKIRQYRYRRPRGLKLPGIKRKLAVVLFGFMVFIAGLWTIGFLVYQGLGRSDFFQITAIKIQGCQRTSKSQVLELSGIDIHSNLLALNMAKVKAKLERLAWIDTVEIDRDWPNRLTISIRERVPVAMINKDDGLYYLDRRGAAFAKVMVIDDLDYPVITGHNGDQADENMEARLGEAMLFIRYAGRGNSILPAQNISEINVRKEDEIVVFLANNPFPIRIGTGMIGTKYSMLSKVLYWLYKKEEFTETAYIDVDYAKNRVLVGMKKSG